MSSQSISNEIIERIKKIYQGYEEKANQLAEDKRQRSGNKIDKMQNDFMTNLAHLEKNMSDLVEEMKKASKTATNNQNQLRDNTGCVQDCLKDIRIILKKKPLSFKVNSQIREIINNTQQILISIRKDLANFNESKFLCCGTDGAKKFKTPMGSFKIVAGKWKMLTLFESKDSIETFVSPKFNNNQFSFITDILRKKWPESKVQKIEVQKEVIREVIRQVNTGKPSILNNANEYLYGINRQQNLMYGLQIYHNEADKNSNPQACAYLGKVYEDGIILPKDMKKALSYYQKAMNGKDLYGSYRYAMCLIKGLTNPKGQSKEDIQKGFNLLTQITSNQYSPCAQALAQLGEIYEFGSFDEDAQKLFVIKKDIKKSITYYTKSKNLHCARASNNLGVLHLNNKINSQGEKSEAGSSEMDKKIIEYLTQAKDQGFGQAFYNLGVIYSKGLIGERDPEKALNFFYEGGLKGDFKCKMKFAYELMNQTSIMKEEYQDHYKLAVQWLEGVVRKLSVKQENSSQSKAEAIKSQKGQALFYLGLIYEHGFGVQKSTKRAFSYFIEASDIDYPAAKNKIGDCYFSGYGIKQDRQLAVGLYLEAAELGNSDAMVNLGTVYLNGIPGLVQRSYGKAYKYFISANQLDNSDAKIHLSYMYRNGLGVEANEQIAKQLLEEAAEMKNATALYMLRQQGSGFNEGVLFDQLQNQFFTAPKKINLKQIVPVVYSIYKSK